jgi:hypothetical protein
MIENTSLILTTAVTIFAESPLGVLTKFQKFT